MTSVPSHDVIHPCTNKILMTKIFLESRKPKSEPGKFSFRALLGSGPSSSVCAHGLCSVEPIYGMGVIPMRMTKRPTRFYRRYWGILLVTLVLFLVTKPYSVSTGSSSLRGAKHEGDKWINDTTQPFDIQKAEKLRNLIIVAGHSMTLSGHLHDADADEADWYLLDYQKGRGLPRAIYLHIEAGINLAAVDANALLVFSGGETRPLGPFDEGSSYFRVADAMQLFNQPLRNESLHNLPGANSVRARTTTEIFATDSFQNLIFSICRFMEITGNFPEKITMVSFSFKERRFRDMHSWAIHWPPDNFFYVGIDPEESTGFNLNDAMIGEMENAARPFETDPYGCHSKVLLEKRKQRNPFKRTPPYELSCPELTHILKWCGPELIPESLVPWH